MSTITNATAVVTATATVTSPVTATALPADFSAMLDFAAPCRGGVKDMGKVASSSLNEYRHHYPATVSGKVSKSFGSDVQGITDKGKGTDFSSSIALTSRGEKITVTEQPPITSDIAIYNPVTGKTTFAKPGPSEYTGTTADGKTAFTLEINSDGTYKFTLNQPLDSKGHESISLNFGVTASNGHGGTDTGYIHIKIAA